MLHPQSMGQRCSKKLSRVSKCYTENFKKMAFKVKMPQNSFKKDLFLTEIRKKLGITKVKLASILKVSRAYAWLVELKKRQGHSTPNTTLTTIFLRFHELETGKQAAFFSAMSPARDIAYQLYFYTCNDEFL
jgi:DNA-binding XRE family transcriptional regulator